MVTLPLTKTYALSASSKAFLAFCSTKKMVTFFFSPKCQKIDIWNKNNKILLSLIYEKKKIEIKMTKKCFPYSLARRGEARRRRRRRRRRGEATAAPRRARARRARARRRRGARAQRGYMMRF